MDPQLLKTGDSYVMTDFNGLQQTGAKDSEHTNAHISETSMLLPGILLKSVYFSSGIQNSI